MLQTLKSIVMLLLLASCTTLPGGPAVLVLPGAEKDFTQFRNDEDLCRLFARNRLTSSQAKTNSSEEAQQQYDIGFMQCMYAKGHRIPLLDPAAYYSLQDEDGDEPVQSRALPTK
ncbi:MAG: hypothetical protein ACU841_06790 [Gammaproteobacteria bacterium]